MTHNNPTPGRPCGRKKTSKIEVLIEPQVKEEFMQLLSNEGKNASTEIGSWIRRYIKSMRSENGDEEKWKQSLYSAVLVD